MGDLVVVEEKVGDRIKIMKFDDFQKESRKTAVYPKIGKNIVYPTLGISGEAGEIAEKVKKIIRDDGGKISKEKKEDLAKEIGDVLWYVSQLATELKVSLGDIAKGNVEKLKSRQKRGKLKGSGDNR